MNTKLSVSNLRKHYGAEGGGINGIDIDVEDGEILALLGPSGSGKSTFLKCVAGLERPDEGRIAIGDEVVYRSEDGTFVPPNRRDVSVVFQSLALWPHMSVFDNVAYPLVSHRVPKGEIRERVVEILSLVGCAHLLHRVPGEISGGEQQRVACARALVGRPRIVLFDEPFSSLDAGLRRDLRRWLLQLRDETNLTGVFVTHDQEEAFMVGDRIAVLFDGDLARLDTPRSVYENPEIERVATFLGTMNLVSCVVARDAAGEFVELKAPFGPVTVPVARAAAGDQVRLGIRPEHVRILEHAPKACETAANIFPATVTFARFAGRSSIFEVDIDGTRLVSEGAAYDLHPGDGVWVELPTDKASVF